MDKLEAIGCIARNVRVDAGSILALSGRPEGRRPPRLSLSSTTSGANDPLTLGQHKWRQHHLEGLSTIVSSGGPA